jgi:hypothetical protein
MAITTTTNEAKMLIASSGPKSLKRLLGRLPTPAEAAAEIQAAARKLGLLIDLHRVSQQLREIDVQQPASKSGGEK